jgi:hypothetical protein
MTTKTRAHIYITKRQVRFLQDHFRGISMSEAVRRLLDEAIERRGWSDDPTTTQAEK